MLHYVVSPPYWIKPRTSSDKPVLIGCATNSGLLQPAPAKFEYYEMPTVLWLSVLPKGVAERAVQNYQQAKKDCFYPDDTTTSLIGALYGGFNWAETPEGADYWLAVKDHVVKCNL